MASSSGVSKEREEFMQLVRTEIKRYDDQLADDQPMSMVFHAGGDDVSLLTFRICNTVMRTLLVLWLCLQTSWCHCSA